MALEDELKELKKLPPQERIKKIKEIEDARKKEIEAAEALLRESEVEIKDTVEFRRKVPIEEVKASEIGALSTASEDAKSIWRVSRNVTTVEAAVETTTQSQLERAASEAPLLQREGEKEMPLYQLEKKAEQQGEMYGKPSASQKQKKEYSATTRAEEEEKAHRDYMK